MLLAGNDPISVNQAQIIKANLAAIDIDVEIKILPYAVLVARAARRAEPFDLYLTGWIADYPDPYDFINVLLDGRTIQATNNVNTAYFDSPEYNRKMGRAARLSGNARYAAYARLDADLTRNAAPFAVYAVANQREFVSARVGC